MTRYRTIGAAGIAAVIVAVAPAFANDLTQLARSAGLSASEARGMTLDEIAAHKFSREGTDNKQVIVRSSGQKSARSPYAAGIDRSAGASESLDAFYVRMINRSVGGDDRQSLPPAQPAYSDPAARAQLAASARISPQRASGMSLGEVAAHKFNRDGSSDNQVTIRE
jgi:hypothetical protein